MKEQPKKPRIKRFLIALTATLGLGAGAFFGTGGDISDIFNKAAGPNPDSTVTISAPARTQTPDNVIYYEDRTVSVDENAADTLGPTTTYSTTIIAVDPQSGQYPVIIVPVDPPNAGNGGGAIGPAP